MELKKYGRVWIALIVLVALTTLGYYAAFSPPKDFSPGRIVTITQGTSASEVAAQLADAHIIIYPQLLRIALHLLGGSTHIQAGPYLFDTPENLFIVAHRLIRGASGLLPVRITFPEGETVRDIAERIHEAFPDISASDVLQKAQPYEGYLFPDTYLFLPSADIDVLIKTMRENFDTKITLRMNDIQASGHPLSDIVIMASLVEKEARTNTVRKIVAGILWNRIRLGMPLQVDAVFGYIFNRDTYSPSFADLKVDSPYNTYLHKGLPPGPINNPSLDSIDAALHPTSTDYLYYLTDKDGTMHYAITYAGHQANQRKYLR